MVREKTHAERCDLIKKGLKQRAGGIRHRKEFARRFLLEWNAE
jgi:hypothetical protein